MKKTFLYILVQIISWPVVSQVVSPIAKANPNQNTDKVVVDVKPDTQNQNKYLLPLFGNVEKTAKELAIDRSFVEMCKKNFPNLIEASKFFADRGWEYLSESEIDTAMHRFNLCYLLNEKNVDAYWGIGVLCFQKGEYENASKMLNKGLDIDSTNASLIVDLATVELACYEKNNHPEDLTLSHNHLAKAIDIDPQNILAWLKRSETEFYLENFENAWDCIHSARLLDITKVDLIFVEKLNEKMKDPKSVFKF